MLYWNIKILKKSFAMCKPNMVLTCVLNSKGLTKLGLWFVFEYSKILKQVVFFVISWIKFVLGIQHQHRCDPPKPFAVHVNAHGVQNPRM